MDRRTLASFAAVATSGFGLARPSTAFSGSVPPASALDADVSALLASSSLTATQDVGDRRWRQVLSYEDTIGAGVTDHTSSLNSFFTTCRTKKMRGSLEPGKTYMVSGMLNPSGVDLDGMGATIQVAPRTAAMNYNIMQPSSAFRVQNLTFDMNGTNVPAPTVDTAGCAIYGYSGGGWQGQTLIRNIRLLSPNGNVAIRLGCAPPAERTAGEYAGLRVAQDAYPSRAIIDQVDASGCLVGVLLYYTSGVRISGLWAGGQGGGVQPKWGIADFGSNGTIANDINVSSVSQHGVVSSYSHRFTARDVSVVDAGQIGLAMGGGSPGWVPANDFVLDGVHASNCGQHGMAVDTTLSTDPRLLSAMGSISNVVLRKNTMYGIYLTNCMYVSVDGVFAENGYSGIGHSGMYNKVAGVSANNQRSGISLWGTPSHPRGHLDAAGLKFAGNPLVYETTLGGQGCLESPLSLTNSGSPEGIVAAPPGSLCVDTVSGSHYVKGPTLSSAGWREITAT